jgi:bifunctional enzyme CysN/CysC
VTFLPSLKKSRIASIEAFHADVRKEVGAGVSTGFTLTEQIYIGRGELMVKTSDLQPEVSRRLRVNLFWMGKKPFQPGKTYYLKLGTAKVPCRLEKINYLIDASETGGETKAAVERHDVADCIIDLSKPLAFDPIARLESTGRFVIVDQYEIAGGGIVREALADEANADASAKPSLISRSTVGAEVRAKMLNQKPALIVIAGGPGRDPSVAAKALEAKLLALGKHAFYLGLDDAPEAGEHGSESGSARIESGWDAEVPAAKLGEAASLLLGAGFIVVAAAKGLDSEDIKTLESLVKPHAVAQLEAAADAEEATGTTAGLVEEALGKLRAAGAI